MTPAYAQTISAYGHGGRFSPDPPAFDVVHSTEGPMSDGNAVALAKWFARSPANGGPGTSATGIFDPSTSVRMLDEHTVPYHVGPVANDLCSGDEHCGAVALTPAQWMSNRGQAMLDRSAKVKAQRAISRGWGLADCRWLKITEVARRTVRGFCTHNDVRLALGGTTHSDPGPNFPYAWYMGRIRYWFQALTGALPQEEFMAALNDTQQAALYDAIGDINRRSNWQTAIMLELADKLGVVVPKYDMRANTGYPITPQPTSLVDDVKQMLRAGDALGDVGTAVRRNINPGFAAVNNAIAAVQADAQIHGQTETAILQQLGQIQAQLAALQPDQPPADPPAPPLVAP